mmetsp:Transcript_68837/g.192182  ORF Transcript_68837/g.192182 Transcript_68837/m.192182 type:complete len:536 (-) Transcript_68837:493-2100(-)
MFGATALRTLSFPVAAAVTSSAALRTADGRAARADKITDDIPPPTYTTVPNMIGGDVKIAELLHLRDLGFASKNVPNTEYFFGGKDAGFSKSSTGQKYSKMIGENDCVLVDIVQTDSSSKPGAGGPKNMTAYHRSGPREYLHFQPKKVRAAIVNCGGLCPGLNDVVHHLVGTLTHNYDVEKIYGIRGGYYGFGTNKNGPPLELTTDMVKDIHQMGGSFLGSGRGGYDEERIVEFLKKEKINQVYVIGGDGTHRGIYKLSQACANRGLNIAVAGVPKTIDNDIALIDRSFGFQSSVQAAQDAITTAETEARGNMPNGIGLVKLMGRSSGYIAAYSTLAHGSVDLCLVPEVPMCIDGPLSCLEHLENIVEQKGYAVAVVAEGAGEELLGENAEVDAGGNKKLPQIGEFMKSKIAEHFKSKGKEATVKYIDPSYMIRSVPANADDSYYCSLLGQGAVHAAMAGYTGFSIGLVNNHTVLLPIPALVAKSPRTMNKHGRTWERVLAVTHQPDVHTAGSSKPAKATPAPASSSWFGFGAKK